MLEIVGLWIFCLIGLGFGWVCQVDPVLLGLVLCMFEITMVCFGMGRMIYKCSINGPYGIVGYQPG